MRSSVLGAVAAVICVFGTVQIAEAATPHFANCTAMHKVAKYKGGIAKVGARDHRSSGHARYRPYVNTTYYKANISMDRDKDGIACEQ